MTYVPIRYYVARQRGHLGLRCRPWAVFDRQQNVIAEFDSRLEARAYVSELRELQLAEAKRV